MIEISASALKDIEDVFAYGFEAFGLDQAISYNISLDEMFERILSQPGIGIAVAGGSIRSFRHRAHRIYYYSDNGRLTILRVLSPRQPLPGQL